MGAMEFIRLVITFLKTITGWVASVITLRGFLRGNSFFNPSKVKRIKDLDADQSLFDGF